MWYTAVTLYVVYYCDTVYYTYNLLTSWVKSQLSTDHLCIPVIPVEVSTGCPPLSPQAKLHPPLPLICTPH